MNGIIHNCTHANDVNVKATEDEMIVKVFHYLEKLVMIAKPRKVLFMAVDGAPSSQQPSRHSYKVPTISSSPCMVSIDVPVGL